MTRSTYLTEGYLVEQAGINLFREQGYEYIEGSDLIPEFKERESYRDVILKNRFISAVKRINPGLRDELVEEVYKRVRDLGHPDFIVKGKIFYDLLTNGVRLTFKEGRDEITRIVKIVDFENVENNEFLVANQFKVEYQYESGSYRIPDLVVFVNGLPVAVFELKSPNSYQTAKDAFNDHKNKIKDIPQLYCYSQVVVVSDGYETKYGSQTSEWERFFVWEGILSDDDVKVEEITEGFYRYIYEGKELTSFEVLLKGLFRKEHLLEFIDDFVFYDKVGENYDKKIATYYQFYTAKEAVKRTKRCVLEGETPEDRRIGVVWHTQGSGKSLTMLFYARKVLKVRELENPLLIFVTDRKNLDEQLYSLFSQMPIVKHAGSIMELQEIIKNTAGGIIFTTIQKFGAGSEEEYPFLTDRKNIIVIADEAHRSQYRELAQNLRKAIPNASFMGFTATPIQLQDRDTYLVFGEPISVYSMDKGLRHKVIVPIYYEPRLSRLHLTNEFIDEEFEEISEGVEPELKEHLKRKYARIEVLILNPDRISKIAKDIVEHFNKRVQELEGKAMVVVISRKVAVELYKAITNIPDHPSVEIVMSGNKDRDPEDFRPHIRNKREMEELLNNFKNPERDPKVVIVVDMLLTGFDIPCLHTMYFDKPMKNHGLVQAIARVNRVFKDKPAGLIVDYIGIADDLGKSLSKYTSEMREQVLVNLDKVIDLLKEKYDIVSSMFYGLDYKNWKGLEPEELSRLTISAYNMLDDDEKKKKFVENFTLLKRVYAIASPHEETVKIRDDVRFFEMIKKMIVKYSRRDAVIQRNIENEISQLISRSISAEEPVDVFSLLEKERPGISILDEDLLNYIKSIPQKNYAADLMAKILEDELRTKVKRNPFRYRSLYEMLKQVIDKYNKKLINAAKFIEESEWIVKGLNIKIIEGEGTGLTEEELPIYDMLMDKERIFESEEEVKYVAREIVNKLKDSITVDWYKKEFTRSKIRMAIKDVLMRAIGQDVEYEKINSIASEIYDFIEQVYKN